MLRDRKLAPLLYDINKKIIATKLQNGRKVLDLRPKLIIYLPAPKEIKDYRAIPLNGFLTKFEYAADVASPEQELQNLFGDWSGKNLPEVGMSSQGEPDNNSFREQAAGTTVVDAAPGLDDSMDGINQLTVDQKGSSDLTDVLLVTMMQSVEPAAETVVDTARQCYVVRLGDTLKSVAMTHPFLKDVSLWRLLAQLNKLSTVIDRHGVPVARLSRGLKLDIPTAEEIKCFRHNLSDQPVIPIAVSQPLSDTSRQDKRGNVPKDLSVASASSRTVFPRRNESLSTETTVVDLAEHCRYVKSSVGKTCTDFRLEVEHGTRWLTIVSYQIFDDKAIRHEFRPDGSRKTLNIDLPLKAVHELAETDIASNWTQYSAAYLQRVGA
jgi:hypothetical protein